MAEPLALSVGQVAERLGVSVTTVRRAIALGQLPARRLSVRRLVIPVVGLKRWLEGQ